MNRARSRSESARQRNQTNFGYIKEYTLGGVFVRDIGNNYATEHKVNTIKLWNRNKITHFRRQLGK